MRERSMKVKGSNMNIDQYINKYAFSPMRIIQGAERGIASRAAKTAARLPPENGIKSAFIKYKVSDKDRHALALRTDRQVNNIRVKAVTRKGGIDSIVKDEGVLSAWQASDLGPRKYINAFRRVNSRAGI